MRHANYYNYNCTLSLCVSKDRCHILAQRNNYRRLVSHSAEGTGMRYLMLSDI